MKHTSQITCGQITYFLQDCPNIMTSCHGNAFCITGFLWGESFGHRWIPFTKGQLCGLGVSLMLTRTNCSTNTRVADDLRRQDANLTLYRNLPHGLNNEDKHKEPSPVMHNVPPSNWRGQGRPSHAMNKHDYTYAVYSPGIKRSISP